MNASKKISMPKLEQRIALHCIVSVNLIKQLSIDFSPKLVEF